MKKLLIITDTTHKQTNGVVRTLHQTMKQLTESGEYIVWNINPENFKTVPLPIYKEIDISIDSWKIGRAHV